MSSFYAMQFRTAYKIGERARLQSLGMAGTQKADDGFSARR